MNLDFKIMKTKDDGFAPVKITITLDSYEELREYKEFNDELLNVAETPMEEEIIQQLDGHLDAMLKCNIPTINK